MYERVCEPSKATPKVWILNIFSPESHLPEGRDRVRVDLGWGVAVTCGTGLPLEDSGTPSSSVQALKEHSVFVFRLRSRAMTWRWWTGRTGTPLAELQGLPAQFFSRDTNSETQRGLMIDLASLSRIQGEMARLAAQRGVCLV